MSTCGQPLQNAYSFNFCDEIERARLHIYSHLTAIDRQETDESSQQAALQTIVDDLDDTEIGRWHNQASIKINTMKLTAVKSSAVNALGYSIQSPKTTAPYLNFSAVNENIHNLSIRERELKKIADERMQKELYSKDMRELYA
jgi:hypothetical protein